MESETISAGGQALTDKRQEYVMAERSLGAKES